MAGGGSRAKGTGDVPGLWKQEGPEKGGQAPGLNPRPRWWACGSARCLPVKWAIAVEGARQLWRLALVDPRLAGSGSAAAPIPPPTSPGPVATAGGGGAAPAQPWPSSGSGSRPWLASSQGELWEGRPSRAENKRAGRVGGGRGRAAGRAGAEARGPLCSEQCAGPPRTRQALKSPSRPPTGASVTAREARGSASRSRSAGQQGGGAPAGGWGQGRLRMGAEDRGVQTGLEERLPRGGVKDPGEQQGFWGAEGHVSGRTGTEARLARPWGSGMRLGRVSRGLLI